MVYTVLYSLLKDKADHLMIYYACGYNGGSMGLLGVNSDSRNVNTPTANA